MKFTGWVLLALVSATGAIAQEAMLWEVKDDSKMTATILWDGRSLLVQGWHASHEIRGDVAYPYVQQRDGGFVPDPKAPVWGPRSSRPDTKARMESPVRYRMTGPSNLYFEAGESSISFLSSGTATLTLSGGRFAGVYALNRAVSRNWDDKTWSLPWAEFAPSLAALVALTSTRRLEEVKGRLLEGRSESTHESTIVMNGAVCVIIMARGSVTCDLKNTPWGSEQVKSEVERALPGLVWGAPMDNLGASVTDAIQGDHGNVWLRVFRIAHLPKDVRLLFSAETK